MPLLTDTVKKDKAIDVKLAAATALGQYRGDARQALPALRELSGQVKDKQTGKALQAIMQAISGKKKG